MSQSIGSPRSRSSRTNNSGQRTSRHVRPLNPAELAMQLECKSQSAGQGTPFFRVGHQRKGFSRRFLDGVQQVKPTYVSPTCGVRVVRETEWNNAVSNYIQQNPNPSSPTGRYSAAEAAVLISRDGSYQPSSPRSRQSSPRSRSSGLGGSRSGAGLGLGGSGAGLGGSGASLSDAGLAGSGLSGVFSGRGQSGQSGYRSRYGGSYGYGSSRRNSGSYGSSRRNSGSYGSSGY